MRTQKITSKRRSNSFGISATCGFFCMFVLLLLNYFQFYIFVFLAEKFRVLTLQQINYASICSDLLGYLIFSLGLYDCPRKVLNFTVSSAILCLSLAMLICSGLFSKYSLDILGLFAMCRDLWLINWKFWSRCSDRLEIHIVFYTIRRFFHLLSELLQWDWCAFYSTWVVQEFHILES